MKFSFTLTPLREWAGSRCCEEKEMEMETEGTGVAWGPLWISVLISRLRQRAPESEFRNCILKPSQTRPDQSRPGQADNGPGESRRMAKVAHCQP